MIGLLFLSAFLAVTQPNAPRWASLPADTAAQLKAEGIHEQKYEQVAAGEIITEGRPVPAGKTGVHMASIGIIHGPIDKLWGAVGDCKQLPGYMPHVESCGLVSPDHELQANQEWDRMELNFRILFFSAKTELVNETTFHAPHYLSWRQVKGDAKLNEGYYRIITIGPDIQLLVFDELVDPGPVPGFVKKWIVKNSLPGIVTGLRRLVDSHYEGYASEIGARS